MKRFNRWMIVPATAAALVSMTGVAFSQTVVQTPLQSATTVSLTSGGAQSSCGNFGNEALSLRITESFASVTVRVENPSADTTLYITGPNNFTECKRPNTQGVVEAPGVLNQGTYTVYVGDRAGNSQVHTVSVSQN
ncbi:MAG: hypothetical protein HC886_22460 [Leptolyngbyaceae cyanobacterium SM1_1_3]|nr:hypothetical protein [Leptolyngbyaceae cyanobacterium SM1_1_3]NJN01970.1 hypothetical protein [Leptolyngbyaceae cyanobacterium RM1_1_2]NJO10135.1 hypothetical protein [Leptolyngbyaceae cyanobacterium SL_1_1]